MLTKDTRKQIIDDFRTHEGDSGSPEVQIALLTADIKSLTEHMKVHRKDFHSRRGLLQKVNRRSKLLRYLNRTAHDRYIVITDKLVGTFAYGLVDVIVPVNLGTFNGNEHPTLGNIP